MEPTRVQSNPNNLPYLGPSAADGRHDPRDPAPAQIAPSTSWLESDEPLCTVDVDPDGAVGRLVATSKPSALPPSFFESQAANDGKLEKLSCEANGGVESDDSGATHFQLSARRFAPFHQFGGYFEGDAGSRNIPRTSEGSGGHSTDPLATARVETTVDVSGNQISATSHCDMSRHPLFGEEQGVPQTVDSSQTGGNNTGHIEVAHAASNPLLPAPDIDTYVHADYEVTQSNLHVEGVVRGDDFPNSEVFISDSAGNSVMLSEFQTEHGSLNGPLGHLWGEGNALLGIFDANIPLDEHGNFTMTCESSTSDRGEAP